MAEGAWLFLLPPADSLLDNKRLPVEVGFLAASVVDVEAVEAVAGEAAFLTLLVFVVPPAAGVSFGELLLLQRGRFFAATIEVGLEVLEVWLSNRLASM